MFVLFTDYGYSGPYVGQLKARLLKECPAVPIVDLMHDVPAFHVTSASHLLFAYSSSLPPGSIVLAIVDPAVGSPQQKPMVVFSNDRYFIGPGNGVFSTILANDSKAAIYYPAISDWALLPATFHGRDIYAPIACSIVNGNSLPENFGRAAANTIFSESSDDLMQVIYIDRYGNLITGIGCHRLGRDVRLFINNHAISYARTFSDVGVGELFWYYNSSGLLEIAANQDSAAMILGVSIGGEIVIL